MATPLDLSTLEAHLWEPANISRGPVDAADFKTYIFPLLFFKRISDVYDEETAQALEESGGDQEYALFPENHRFQIPVGCHWPDVRARTSNIGQALQRAQREIEKANQRIWMLAIDGTRVLFDGDCAQCHSHLDAAWSQSGRGHPQGG